jgi:lysophospholipid acyltransferase (LPLAT)-like uncharacterized protein
MEGFVAGLRWFAGACAAVLARVWLLTLRVRVHNAGVLDVNDTRPRVLAFFHGTQLMLQRLPRARRTCVMVSHSRDGEIQAAALSTLGFDVVRGSSSRGGARALAAMVRKLRQPRTDAVFAVDGPRGPYGLVKPGVLVAAGRSGASIIPAGAAARRKIVLDRAWDRFVLPWPFTRVDIVLGPHLDPAVTGGDGLAAAIAACNAAANETVVD